MAPPSALKSPERSQDPEVPLSTPVFALGPGPESSQRGYPAFGAREFRVHISCSVQLSSVAQSYLTLCYPMNRSTPGLPVHHQLLESTQTQAH